MFKSRFVAAAHVALYLCCVHAGTPEVSPTMVCRLREGISTQTAHAGDPIKAVVIADAIEDGRVVIPQGSLVLGRVVRVQRVGAGLIHERATLRIGITQWQSGDGALHPFSARLVDVDNAREQVSGDGRITGILAAGGPPGFLLGMWDRPTDALLTRTALGMAGIAGFLGQHFDLDPIGIAAVSALRLMVVPSAEPEIWYPPGTDLILELPPAMPTDYGDEVLPDEASPELTEWGDALPVQTSRMRSAGAADVTNIVFLGSGEQLNTAFSAAGWHQAEAFSHQSVGRFYRAMSAQRGYPSAPMSTLLLENKPPACEFEKSLNTISRRHHVRIWQQRTWEGREAWLGAGTHDTAVHFGLRGFTHQIDPQIDRERQRMVDDLAFAGCVANLQMVDRPAEVSSQGGVETDGRLAVITLRDCTPAPAAVPNPPGESVGARLARRLVLEARYAVLRGNIYYWGYRAGREWFVRSRRPATLGKPADGTLAVLHSPSQNRP